jgi:hypothetical protein
MDPQVTDIKFLQQLFKRFVPAVISDFTLPVAWLKGIVNSIVT